MSVYSTKYLGRDRDYIVIKHNLRGVNLTVQGVKFRGGYAVVEKDSKTYHMLRKFPNLRNSPEFPLTTLGTLPFITRARDVQTVYGKDVYIHYVKAVNEAQAKQAENAKLEAERKEQEEQAKREAQLAEKQRLEEEKKKLQEEIAKAKEEAEQEQPQEELVQALEKVETEEQSFSDKCIFRTTTGKLCKNDAIAESPSGYCKMHLLQDPRLVEFGIEKPKFMAKKDRKAFKDKVIKTLAKAKKEGKF